MCNTEDLLHALDRVVPDKPLRILIVGVGNGGEMQVWQDATPQAVLMGIDPDPRCAELGLNVMTVDPQDVEALRTALRGCWFDVIVDRMGGNAAALWPFMRPQGLLILPIFDTDEMFQLMKSLRDRNPSWLPSEEIMCVSWFANVAVIEKRNPLVVPYLNIMVGADDQIVAEQTFLDMGGVRIMVPETSTDT